MSKGSLSQGVGAGPLVQFRLEAAIEVLGRRFVAKFFGVTITQITKWVTGTEDPGPEAVRPIIDLDHVVARARLIWGARAVRIWMDSPNAYLHGARPIDALKADGAATLIEVLDAEAWGGAT